MSKADELKGDCYSSGERAWMVYTQKLRGKWLLPLLLVLTRLGIRPDHLTLLSLCAGLAFCPLYATAFPLALFFLLLHVALDGLDGPLARHLGVASRSGSFTDTMSDQAVIAATTLTLMVYGAVDAVAGALYISVYTVVVLFAIARNVLRAPYSWLFRPRFFVYGWIAVNRYLLPGSLNGVVWVCVILLACKMLTGFIRIRKHL